MLSNHFCIASLLVSATFSSLVSGSKYVLGQFKQQDWDEALGHPNATGSLPITVWDIIGWHITKEWPGADKTEDESSGVRGFEWKQSLAMEGWTLLLNASADVMTDNDGEYESGASFALKPPASLIQTRNGSESVQIDPSWHMAGVLIQDLSTDILDLGLEDDGFCHHMLGKECVENLANAVTSNVFGEGTGGFQEIPDSCPKMGTAPFIPDLSSANFGHHSIYNWTARRSHERGNQSIYDAFVKTTFPVFLTWNGTREGEISGPSDYQTMMTSVVCLRADAISPGSREIQDSLGDGRADGSGEHSEDAARKEGITFAGLALTVLSSGLCMVA